MSQTHYQLITFSGDQEGVSYHIERPTTEEIRQTLKERGHTRAVLETFKDDEVVRRDIIRASDFLPQ